GRVAVQPLRRQCWTRRAGPGAGVERECLPNGGGAAGGGRRLVGRRGGRGVEGGGGGWRGRWDLGVSGEHRQGERANAEDGRAGWPLVTHGRRVLRLA